MIHALAASFMAALLLTFVCRASRPGMVLSFLGNQWQAWLIMRPTWLNAKASGSCVLCTTFWFIGIPAAVISACFLDTGYWTFTIPLIVSVLVEKLLE